MKQFANFIEKTCPVGDTLQNGVQLVLSDIIVEK